MRTFTSLLFFSLAVHMALAATCVVDPQATTSVPLSVSTNTNNIVRFQFAVPDEKHTSGNTITDLTYTYSFGACVDGRLSYAGGVPDPSTDAISYATAELVGSSAWKSYRVVNSGPACDTVYLFRELPLDAVLSCLAYTDKINGELIYTTGAAGVLARTYSVALSADGVQTTTESVIQDLYEFNINVQEQYTFELDNVQMNVELIGSPVNPDGNAVIKTVVITTDAGKRVYTVTLQATSKFPFELRTGSTGIAVVNLASHTAESGTIQVSERCDSAFYNQDGQTCAQDVVIVLTSPSCSFSNLDVNVGNSELKYGCAADSGALCPLTDDTVATTGTFDASTPIDITLNSASTCTMDTDFNFQASLQAALTSSNGLIATNGVSGSTWDTTARKRYLYKTSNNIYFNVEVLNVATVAVVSWVDIDHIAVHDVARNSDFTAEYSYYTADSTNCNTTVTVNTNKIYRTCAILPLATGFTKPADNVVEQYTITVFANVYLRDKTVSAGLKRAALAFDVVPAKASASVAMVSSADNTGASGSAGSSTVAIAASVGVVGIALVVGLVAVLIFVFRAKKAATQTATAAAGPVAVL